MTYRYLFGPVPSRRLGISLGVDLVPRKVCTLDCVYCECGATTNLTVERREYVPFDSVASELKEFLSVSPAPDFITFSGSGEPTLNSRTGDVIDLIRGMCSVPLAVLTNGTLLSDPAVRKELMSADLVLPSLDAATAGAFQRINRPHPVLSVKNYIKGLCDFRSEFSGRIWLEVLILPGFNDHRENLDSLREVLAEMKPDRIQLNTLDRPGVVENLRPADLSFLQNIIKDWRLPGLEIISSVSTRRDKISFRKDTEQAILETIERRPCTVMDLGEVLNLHVNEINKYLSTLEDSGRIEAVSLERGVFYRVKR